EKVKGCPWIPGVLTRFVQQAPDADAEVYVQFFKLAAGPWGDFAAVLEAGLKAYPDNAALLAQAEAFLAKVPAAKAADAVAKLSGSGFASDYVAGRLYAVSSQPDKAIEAFVKSAAAKKDFAPAQIARMRVLLADKKYDDVLTVRAEAEKAGLKAAGVNHLAGLAYLAKKQVADAINELRTAETLDRDNVDIALDLADAYMADKQPAGAMRRLRRMYEKEPKNLKVLLRLARINEQMGQYDEAVIYANAVQKVEPKNTDAARIKAMALLNDGRVPQAITALEAIVKDNPDDARCQTALGEAMVLGGRWNDAIKPLQKALALDQSLTGARRALADAFSKTGRLDDAIEQWKILVDKLPNDMEIAGSLMAELLRRNDLEDAAKLLDKLTAGRDLFAQQLVELAMEAGKRDLAAKIIAKQIASAPDAAGKRKWQFLNIRLLARSTQPDDAIRQAKEFYDKDPSDRELATLYIAVLLRAKRVDDAVPVAKASAEKNPDSSDAAETAVDVLVAAKKFDDAIALADRWVKKSTDPDQVREWKLTRVGVLQSAKRQADAVKAAKEVYDDASDQAPVVLAYARILLWAKDYAGLLAVLDKAQAAKMDSHMLIEMRMEALAKQGKFDEMKKVLDAHVATLEGKEKADGWYSGASVYSVAGKSDESRKALEESLKADPEHVSSANDLGYQLADLGLELERAEKLIRMAAVKRPDTSAYLDSLAWLLYKKGKFAESAELLARVMEMEPDPDPVICDHYGDVLYRLGKKADALAQWKVSVKAREEDPDRPVGLEQSTLEKTKAKIKASEGDNSDVPVAPLGQGVTPPGSSRI
ncbi:MAG: tetratricopeptide repeat protein, partial [Phycisphaerae bacterium]|nr:tetratricopeptide repeat protein [Phycisphaerae bacterium]